MRRLAPALRSPSPPSSFPRRRESSSDLSTREPLCEKAPQPRDCATVLIAPLRKLDSRLRGNDEGWKRRLTAFAEVRYSAECSKSRASGRRSKPPMNRHYRPLGFVNQSSAHATVLIVKNMTNAIPKITGIVSLFQLVSSPSLAATTAQSAINIPGATMLQNLSLRAFVSSQSLRIA